MVKGQSILVGMQELRLSGALSGDKEITRIYTLEWEYATGRVPLPLDPSGKPYNDPNVDQHLVASKYLSTDVDRMFRSEPWNVHKGNPLVATWRQRGKTFNFKVIYGGSAASMMLDLQCSLEEAEKLQQLYFQGFSGLYEWIQVEGNLAALTRWVRSALGRHILINEDNAKGMGGRGTAVRKAVNAIIQGSGADMTKLALPRMRRAFHQLEESYTRQLRGRYARIVNVSHDEVNFLAPGYVDWQLGRGNVVRAITDPDHYRGTQLDEFLMAREFSEAGRVEMETAEQYIFDRIGMGRDLVMGFPRVGEFLEMDTSTYLALRRELSLPPTIPPRVDGDMSVYWKH